MHNQRSFRLFVSSTFSDFSAEREVLQTRVFPKLRDYCRQKGGFSFQPIDLRWGVTQEAQLDQRTIDLCLNEVRSCKSHPAPNFLILAGDRYGWVPLPYSIEKAELDTLLTLMPEEDQILVGSWYEFDENQVPESYVLKSRSGDYVEFEAWNAVEIKLRTAFNRAVETSDLPESSRRKYVLSATEAEVFEGILEYGNEYSEYQKDLISRGLLDPQYDRENVFAFIRSISGEKADSVYADKHPQQATQFKQAIRQQIQEILDVETFMQSDGTPEDSYLTEFEQRVSEFLKNRVDAFSNRLQQQSDLEQEIQQHAGYAEQKLQNFRGRESSRKVIAAYIDDSTHDETPHPEQALIVYGPSGSGKSALMAKAASEANALEGVQVIQRYIGATPQSGSTVSLLLSVLEELGIETADITPNTLEEQKLSKKDFDFDKFCEEVSYRLAELDEDLSKKVLFIDAVDQLENEDHFLWLPATLPSNLKIVISALEDGNYPEASVYYETLKNRPLNFHKVPEMEEPLTLLNAILASYHRRLQPHQEQYFLQKYEHSRSPLFISLAAQELRYWRSSDSVDDKDLAGGTGENVQDLADSQQGLIAEFISNLSTFYHHDPDFVRVVLGFIHASKDGLSESEMLQLISTEPELVRTFAPETWHSNPTGELPTVIWARLYAQLTPFLKRSMLDGEELMSFFHREFATVIKQQEGQAEVHRKAVEACQKMILKHQHEHFDSTRWGKLYVTLVTEYELRYPEDNRLEEDGKFVSGLEDVGFIKQCLNFLDKAGYDHQKKDLTYQISFLENKLQYLISKPLFDNKSNLWIEQYLTALVHLSQCSPTQSIQLMEKATQVLKERFNKDDIDSISDLAKVLQNLSEVYIDVSSDNRKALKTQKKCVKLWRTIYLKDKIYLDDYIWSMQNLADIYSEKTGNQLQAIYIIKRAIKVNHGLSNQDEGRYLDQYESLLTSLSNKWTDLCPYWDIYPFKIISKKLHQKDFMIKLRQLELNPNTNIHFSYIRMEASLSKRLRKRHFYQTYTFFYNLFKNKPQEYAISFSSWLIDSADPYLTVDTALESVLKALSIKDQYNLEYNLEDADKCYEIGSIIEAIRGEHDKSITMLQKSFEIRTELLGPDHEDTNLVQQRLAEVRETLK